MFCYDSCQTDSCDTSWWRWTLWRYTSSEPCCYWWPRLPLPHFPVPGPAHAPSLTSFTVPSVLSSWSPLVYLNMWSAWIWGLLSFCLWITCFSSTSDQWPWSCIFFLFCFGGFLWQILGFIFILLLINFLFVVSDSTGLIRSQTNQWLALGSWSFCWSMEMTSTVCLMVCSGTFNQCR